MAPFSKIPENLLASAPPHTTLGTVPAVAYWGGEAGLSASVAAFPRKAGGWIHRVGHRRCTCAAIPIPSRFTIIPASSARPPAPARKPTLTGPNHWTCTLVQKNHLQPSLIQSQHVILCPRKLNSPNTLRHKSAGTVPILFGTAVAVMFGLGDLWGKRALRRGIGCGGGGGSQISSDLVGV